MRAIREFKYIDREHQRSVTVNPGEAVDISRLTGSKVDIEKLERTGFLARAERIETHAPRETVKVKGSRRKRED